MKRLIISITIIALIGALGIFSIIYIDAQNDRLYGKLEEVAAGYKAGKDVSEALELLEAQAKEYAKCLTALIDDEKLGEIVEAATTLKTLYHDNSEEFATECARIRHLAETIYLSELPRLGRIL